MLVVSGGHAYISDAYSHSNQEWDQEDYPGIDLNNVTNYKISNGMGQWHQHCSSEADLAFLQHICV